MAGAGVACGKGTLGLIVQVLQSDVRTTVLLRSVR